MNESDSGAEFVAGAVLPDLIVHADNPMLMAYGAATWDWHRLHYDADVSRNSGLAGPIVDGQMFGALIARQIRSWAGSRAVFKSLKFRNRRFAAAGVTLTFRSVVTHAESGTDGLVITVRTDAIDDAEIVVCDGGETVIVMPK